MWHGEGGKRGKSIVILQLDSLAYFFKDYVCVCMERKKFVQIYIEGSDMRLSLFIVAIIHPVPLYFSDWMTRPRSISWSKGFGLLEPTVGPGTHLSCIQVGSSSSNSTAVVGFSVYACIGE